MNATLSFSLRSHAIACVNQFIIGRAQALMDNIDTFIEVSAARLRLGFLLFAYFTHLLYLSLSLLKFGILTSKRPLSGLHIFVARCVVAT